MTEIVHQLRQSAKRTITISKFARDPETQAPRYVQEEHECEVTIEIDVDALMRVLGRKALLNKSRTAKEVDGLVVVKVREIGK